MPKSKDKEVKKSKSINEFNPCRPTAKGRPSERLFWVDELITSRKRDFKDAFETAAKRWAKAAVRAEADGVEDVESGIELYKANIPGTRKNTEWLLETVVIPAIEKKFGRESSYTMTDDGLLTFTVGDEVSTKKKSKKAEPKKSKKAVKAKADDEDEDEDEDDESDEDESDDDEDDEDED